MQRIISEKRGYFVGAKERRVLLGKEETGRLEVLTKRKATEF